MKKIKHKHIKVVAILILGMVILGFATNLVRAATPAGSSNFGYQLLEQFPGFYNEGDKMSDFPAFILAIYKFCIWTVGIAGLFMMVVGGIMYMGSAGNTSTAGSAKGIIIDSIIGIIAALSAFVLLYVINPDLTKLNLNLVPAEIAEGEDQEILGSSSTTMVTRNGQQIDISFNEALNKIKNEQGINVIVTSGLRDLAKQKQLIAQNCGGYPPTRPCSPTTCLLKNGPDSCPHTTGRAADIWALNGSVQALTQSQCLSNLQACFNNPYQSKLIAAMKSLGFCVLSNQPWHFEKPKMSSRCVF